MTGVASTDDFGVIDFDQWSPSACKMTGFARVGRRDMKSRFACSDARIVMTGSAGTGDFIVIK